MNSITDALSLGAATGRWSALGPYYAMFPIRFAFEVVDAYSNRGDAVIDPFAGRASSVYAASVMGRCGVGIEINPVGWLYGFVKLKPAPKARVLARIEKLDNEAKELSTSDIKDLPDFFLACYSMKVLRYLLAARSSLRWKASKTDATVMALILVNLHGKRSQALSNQMRQGKAMSPTYSVKWWKEKGLVPPDIDPAEFLRQRAEWRYKNGAPDLSEGTMILGDSTLMVDKLGELLSGKQDQFQLLFTSPPYYGVTNYYYDQWLRLWMLGGPNQPASGKGNWRKKFTSKPAYRDLLQKVFHGCADIMADDAIIYVRTDAREFTYDTTLEVLQGAFPDKHMRKIERPYSKKTQTALFGDTEEKPGEIDIVLQ